MSALRAVCEQPDGRGPSLSPGQVHSFTGVLKLERMKMNQ